MTRDDAIALVQGCGLAFRTLPRVWRGDREIVLAAVAKNGLALKHASAELRRDHDVVDRAVLQNSRAGRFALIAPTFGGLALITDSESARPKTSPITAKICGSAPGSCRDAGASVLTASDDNTAKVWDSNTGACDEGGVSLLTASEDTTAKVWDSASGAATLTKTAFTDHRIWPNPVIHELASQGAARNLTGSDGHAVASSLSGTGRPSAWICELLTDLEDAVLDYDRELASVGCHADCHGTSSGDARQRDIFPLPRVPSTVDCAHLEFLEVAPSDVGSVVVGFANLCVVGLNYLAGYASPRAAFGRCAPQRKAQAMCIHKAVRFIARLERCERPLTAAAAWTNMVGDAAADAAKKEGARLVAERCDLLDDSARVDPTDALGAEDAAIVGDPGALFEKVTRGDASGAYVGARDRAEYAKLVLRQLRCNKVSLRWQVSGWASVFAVNKGSGGQREVWNGSRISAAALRPPRPPHIATPVVFGDIELESGQRLRLSKRDARCYFDQLRLPSALRGWFGRPPLTKHDFVRWTDVTEDELESYLHGISRMPGSTRCWPVSNCWPMGFSWSSFIAQSKLLLCCRRAGLGDSRMLADDLPFPRESGVTFALATDDVMVFTIGPASVATPWLRRLDSSIAKAGIEAHHGKNVDGELNETAVGVDLVDGERFAPHGPKLAKVLGGTLYFVREGLASPLQVSAALAALGHLSWFALLVRPTFGCFSTIYRHAAASKHDLPAANPDEVLVSSIAARAGTTVDEAAPAAVPRTARVELLAFLCLAPLLENDLFRPWQEHIIACDASCAFGFGVSVAPCAPEVARDVGRAGSRHDVFTRLDRDHEFPDEEPERERAGHALRVPLTKAAFSTVVSAKAVHAAHSGALEAHGVTLALKWVLRSPARHGRRTTLLVDARAVLGAVRKGRSSAPTIAREVRRISAHVLAGDLLLKVAYVPSEENPADAPSRGVVRRWLAKPAPTAGAQRRIAAPRRVRQRHLKLRPSAADNLLYDLNFSVDRYRAAKTRPERNGRRA